MSPWRRGRDENVDIEPDEFISKSVKTLGLFRRKEMVHCDIFAFDVTNVLQSLSK